MPQQSQLAVLAIAGLLLPCGCQLYGTPHQPRVPAVSTRYTVNPLSDSDGKLQKAAQLPTVPSVKLGLAMQSGIDPVHTHFAARLGTVLVRELQLSSGTLAIEPLATLQAKVEFPAIDSQSTGDVMAVAFTDAQETLPSQLPPNPMFLSAAPPLVDQILVIRVIEYRPYFPLLATLELRLLDGETQTPILATTITWSGEDYRLAENPHKKSLKQKLFSSEKHDQPSPGHNSPQALMHEISKDIASWYNQSLITLQPMGNQKKRTLRERWFSPSGKDPCKSCEATSAPPMTPAVPIP